MAVSTLNLDYESKSEADLKKVGLDVYASHPSTEILMASYSIDRGPTQHWDATYRRRMPAELKDALSDPHVVKKAFNAQFERVMTDRVARIKTPVKSWRCTMAMAYLQSFTGTLEDVGRQVGLPPDKQKMADGKRLIRMFSVPQRVRKNQPYRWRDSMTDPEDWDTFCEYNVQDTETEMAIERRLSPFFIPDAEWELYHLDQEINDHGLPIDMDFVENAIWMAAKRKKELVDRMCDITGLANPNSTVQLMPWLKKRGYPFSDLRKDTVKKVMQENENAKKDKGDEVFGLVHPGGFLSNEAEIVLDLRKEASRTSIKKYDALKAAVGADHRMRFVFQFAGASRTGRWAGRRFQPTNLPRTPKILEAEETDTNLAIATDLIRDGSYEGLELFVGEPMTALVGALRSAIRAPEGYELRVCDLASIESCVIGWLAGCERLLNVFRSGKDSYKDFATVLYGVPYDQVTKTQRTNAKPAVLGAGYRLGGGTLREGKRTGLWGYAENMGINLTKQEAHDAVSKFREAYPEIVELWYALEKAVFNVIRSGRPMNVGPLRFELRRPYLVVTLPSGRAMYYYKPRVEMKEYVGENGEPYTKKVFTYEGSDQKTGKWKRIDSHGGKLVENFVQAIAREILVAGMRQAKKEGFNIVIHVYDEIGCMEKVGDKVHTMKRLGEIMTRELPWAYGLPLAYDGWSGTFYRK